METKMPGGEPGAQIELSTLGGHMWQLSSNTKMGLIMRFFPVNGRVFTFHGFEPDPLELVHTFNQIGLAPTDFLLIRVYLMIIARFRPLNRANNA
jgi:hypothetical protein